MTLVGVFISSLVGSLHCAGMCGPFFLLINRSKNDGAFVKIFYHLGRLTTYLSLAWLIRTIFPNTIIEENKWLSLLILGLWITFLCLPKKAWPKLSKVLSGTLKKTANAAPSAAAYATGVLTTLIPCAWLYGFILLAAAQSDWQQTGLFMLVFWLGTIPALVSSQFVLSRFQNLLKGRSQWLAVATMSAFVLASVLWHYWPHHHHH